MRRLSSLALRRAVPRRLPAALGLRHSLTNTTIITHNNNNNINNNNYNSNIRCLHTTSLRRDKVIPFKLADIGEGILEVEVLQVFAKEGDQLKAFDKICEVQSDKATVEITSRYDGKVVKLHIEKGAKAFVGKPIAELEVSDKVAAMAGAAEKPEKPEGAPTKKDTPTAGSPPVSETAGKSDSSSVGSNNNNNNNSNVNYDEANEQALASGKVLATPATRRLAKENNIDLSRVKATGKGGRIMKEDVLAYMEHGASAAATVSREDRVVPISGIRKAMVKSMTEANKIPAFGAADEIDITALMQARELMKPLFKKRSNGSVSLSYLPFFIKAASLALLQYPELNALTNADCTELQVKGSHNIGFAMDSAGGLIVPNIKNVEQKSVYEIAEELAGILEKGKQGNVPRDRLEGGTFTLSNIGSIGATYCSPVIFPPQVVIGAIGKMTKVPRFDSNGQVVPAHIINVSWSADHRVVDGATMVRYSNLFKSYLENPVTMLMDMK